MLSNDTPRTWCDLLGEIAYEWILNGAEHPREQELTGQLGLGYPFLRRLIPFMMDVEVPVSTAKAFDYRLQGALVWEF